MSVDFYQYSIKAASLLNVERVGTTSTVVQWSGTL